MKNLNFVSKVNYKNLFLLFNRRNKFLLLLLYFFLCFSTYASYILGGTIGIKHDNTLPNNYSINMALIIDLNATLPGTQSLLQTNNFVFARIFRKSDNVKMADLTLPYLNHFDISFQDYPTCSLLRDVKQRVYNYKLSIVLDPDIYADTQGYYLVWERCCRNDDIDNIQQDPDASMVLYAEFPSLKLYPDFSSPVFSLADSKYICLNKLFTFDFGVTDSDNDVIKYKLVTPINGNNVNQFGSFDKPVVAGPYPLIKWASGLSTSNSIPSDVELQIDETEGILKVKPNEVGLYLFTIECTVFRNGVQIGLTRLDFQLPVVDCSVNTPPTPIITYKNVAMNDIEHCETGDAILATDNDPSWLFQWQKDGLEIPGATSSTFNTNKEGIYKVIKSLNSVCAEEIASTEVNLTFCERGLKIYVPSAFSPNSDGKNDELQVFGKSVTTFNLLVYNRWGELVFESNDINILWNGGFKNDISQTLPVGQYNYSLQATFNNGEMFEKRDTVMLLR